MSAKPTTTDPDDDLIPAGAGLPQGTPPARPAPDAPPSSTLIPRAAAGQPLTGSEQQDLLDYFLTNGGLPEDEDPVAVEFTVGRKRKQTNVWHFRPITWDEWQDAIERATDKDTGIRDSYVIASWNVARALVRPTLGRAVSSMQDEDPKTGPADAAEVLRRMFRKQSGVLLNLGGDVLAISKLQSDDGSTRLLDQEVEAGKL